MRAWESADHFVDQNESLEHFVRQQPPARCQADTVSPLLHQPVFDKLSHRNPGTLDTFLAELQGNLSKANTPRQPEPKEKTLLQRSPARDRGPLQTRPVDVLFQGVSGRKPHRFDVWRGRSQHRMRVHAKTEVRLPRPILQIVT